MPVFKIFLHICADTHDHHKKCNSCRENEINYMNFVKSVRNENICNGTKCYKITNNNLDYIQHSVRSPTAVRAHELRGLTQIKAFITLCLTDCFYNVGWFVKLFQLPKKEELNLS